MRLHLNFTHLSRIMTDSHFSLVLYSLGVDYTCVLDVQFGCAFHRRMRFQYHFQCRKLKNDIKNACDGETHTQAGHPKRKCNRPLRTLKILRKHMCQRLYGRRSSKWGGQHSTPSATCPDAELS
jgi:hypothetical protein